MYRYQLSHISTPINLVYCVLLYNVPLSWWFHAFFSYGVTFRQTAVRKRSTMILMILVFASSVQCYSEQEFNNSVIRQPPWKLLDCDRPYNRTNKVQCPMCEAPGNCTIHAAVILPASDNYIVNKERVSTIWCTNIRIFTTNVFLTCWKTPLITSFPKNSCPKLIHFKNFLEIEYILPEFQSSFRVNYSCSIASLDVSDNVIQACDRNKITALVLLARLSILWTMIYF